MQSGAQSSTTRLELLLFRLNSKQHFGINVLKVKEIIPRPELTQIPHASPTVVGVAELRGQTVPVIDLAMAIGGAPISAEKNAEQKVIIAEFSRTTQGFLVSGVDRIVVRDWKEVLPPPSGAASSYVTGVIRMEDELVQLVDVEQVLHQVSSNEPDAQGRLDQELLDRLQERNILVVDDSDLPHPGPTGHPSSQRP
jgi:two-component system chemotaxis response regulator CheV